MEPERIFLDTDVVVNWLLRETESVSGKELWKAPYEIVKLSELQTVSALISLTTLMEIRCLLRRKKFFDTPQIEEDLAKVSAVFDVIIPDETSLLRANTLQTEHPLDPFDAVHLSLAIGAKPVTLISRDGDFIKLARHFVETATPEEFLKSRP